MSLHRSVASLPTISKHDPQPHKSHCYFTLRCYSLSQEYHHHSHALCPHTQPANHRQTNPTRDRGAESVPRLSSRALGPSLSCEAFLRPRSAANVQLHLARIHQRHKVRKARRLRFHFPKCAPEHWGPAGKGQTRHARRGREVLSTHPISLGESQHTLAY